MAENRTGGENDPKSHEHSVPVERRSEDSLIASSARWIEDALKAWADEDYAKVAVLAPLAVEHLGKAVLWRENPVLVVPLTPDAEPSLFSLATKPDLAYPKLRTVGLKILFHRLEQLLGGLPIDGKQRTRMVEIRNGAMHVGSPAQSRHVLLDALAVCGVLIERLGDDQPGFYGDHHSIVLVLLDQKRTEVGHRVAAKLARARARLRELEERLGKDLFDETTGRLEEHAADTLNPADFGTGLWDVDEDCPECGFTGRLFGRVDVAEIDYDVEPFGNDEYGSSPYVASWSVTLFPKSFACNVCRLTLAGPEELSECELPASRREVDPSDLGDDFDPQNFAEFEYGLHD